MKYRIGYGFDAHRYTKGVKLILGGVEIPYEYGLKGHSDADVLTHSICDALLGSVNAGDIGKHFPSSDQDYEGISSLILLRKTYSIVSDMGYSLGNIDSVIICEEPKLADFMERISATLSDTLNTSKDNISIKATTTDKMGYIGRKEGIASYTVVLVSKNE